MKFKALNEKINFIPIFPGQDGKYTDQHGVQILPGAFATEQSAIRAELQPEYAKSGRIDAKDVRSIDGYIPSSSTNDGNPGQNKGPSSKGQNQQGKGQNQQGNGQNQQGKGQNQQGNGQNQQGNGQNQQGKGQNQQGNGQNSQNQQSKNLGGSDDGYLYVDVSTGEEFLMVNGELVSLDEIYI